MNTETMPLHYDVAAVDVTPVPAVYAEHGFTGDATTADWLLRQASRRDGCIQQGWEMRLADGAILVDVRNKVPGFFDQWLRIHWPQESRTSVTRKMATYQHREVLTPFMADDVDCSRANNPLPVHAVDTIALGGAIPEVIEEVLRRLREGDHVGADDVAALNRQAKAKRSGKPAPRVQQPTEALALTFIRKGEVDRVREALDLAARAVVVTAEQVMAEQRLRELGKQRVIYGMDADFHRQKDGTWIRLPHAGRVDVPAMPEPEALPEPEPEPAPEPERVQTELIPAEPCEPEVVVMSRADAAIKLNMTVQELSSKLIPSRNPNRSFIRNGWRVEPAGARGMYRLTKVAAA